MEKEKVKTEETISYNSNLDKCGWNTVKKK